MPASVEERAERLGAAIAERGWVLLNGGRDAGVMQASARGAREAGGLVVGVLPGTGQTDAGVAEHVEVAVFTGMGEARNQVNVLSSDVAVLLPGGSGTLSEAALAVKTGTPLVLLNWPDEDATPAIEGPARRADSVEEALALIEEILN